MTDRSDIAPAELKNLLSGENPPFLLDVRDPDECEMRAIPGYANIPLYELASRIDAIPRDRLIVVYCETGLRSLRAQKRMAERGIENVLNLAGGIAAYVAQGLMR